MFDVIKMMHSLSHLPFEELLALSAAEGAQSCSHPSKIEIITAIIANRVEKANSLVPNTRYRITEPDNSEHYLLLTSDQERFLKWNINNCIDYDCCEVDRIEGINWETP